jgi:hypothetical protein
MHLSCISYREVLMHECVVNTKLISFFKILNNILWGVDCMTIINNRIELNENENEKFIKVFKCGIARQLYREKLLTSEQLDQILKSINK